MERAELRKLLLATGCAEERGDVVFMHDPKRGLDEKSIPQAPAPAVEGGWLCVPTGGTSGGVKFARHDERTLAAAVRGFCGHFGLARVNAVDVLPAHHVSGLMARVRCAATGGEHLAWDWKRLEAGETPAIGGGDWVISLVPTQLQRLLSSRRTISWLREFEIVFLGGGPAWPELADAAAGAQLRVALSYGMTETAAMVTALRPEEFLAGARNCGAALPHAAVSVDAEGAVSIMGESVFRGYWPEWREARRFETEDLGRIDDQGRLRILGRRDAVIITGGKKVSPGEVEATLRASGEFDDVTVIGVPDAEWGEAVVACYPAGGRPPDTARAVAALAGYMRPKRFVPIVDWPRNELGKVNRAALRAALGD